MRRGVGGGLVYKVDEDRDWGGKLLHVYVHSIVPLLQETCVAN